ncbi:MAG: DUF305 domain-containing protein [Nitriliruptoraceae bacterium]
MRTKLIATILTLTALVAVLVGAAAAFGPPFATAGDDDRPGPGARAGDRPGPQALADADEADYLARMIPHHEEAITAAEQLRDGTERAEMRELATSIIEQQSAELDQLEAWLDEYHPDADRGVDYEPMMRDLDGLEGDELDRAFLEDMIPHHRTAVMMSHRLVFSGAAEHDDVADLARDIADEQREEMHQMRLWLADWFDVAPGAGPEGERRMGHAGAGRRGGPGDGVCDGSGPAEGAGFGRGTGDGPGQARGHGRGMRGGTSPTR